MRYTRARERGPVHRPGSPLGAPEEVAAKAVTVDLDRLWALALGPEDEFPRGDQGSRAVGGESVGGESSGEFIHGGTGQRDLAGPAPGIRLSGIDGERHSPDSPTVSRRTQEDVVCGPSS